MFGSKIRSWMENHIVRPRKKGNKNKNSNGTSTTASNNLTQNGHGHKGTTGFTIYHGDGTTTTASITATAPNGSISSPARRREVSPIQNHFLLQPTPGCVTTCPICGTTSRFGWQSPSEESAMSPKSDNFLYVQHSSVKAQTLSAAPTKGSHQHQRNIIGGSNGGVSGSCNAITDHTGKESHQQHQQQQYQQQQGKRTKTLSPSSMFRRKSAAGNAPASSATNAKHPSSQIHPVAGVEKSKQKYLKGGCSNSHYEEIQNNNNQQQQQQSHRKEYILEQKDLTSYHNGDGKKEATTPRYGKLLPSKMAGDGYSSSQQQFGSYDSLNANVAYAAGGGVGEMDERVPSNNNNGGVVAGGHVNGGYPSGAVSNVVLRNGNGFDPNRQMLRSSRYNGTGGPGVGAGTGPGTGGGPSSNGMMSNGLVNHPMGHIMNSLSSPESAYSTGYSTDGTSPGATYTPPEYYINMRTGTHYFPKSVNTLAIEAQRYKFGLNKIEEMSPQDPLPNNNNNNNHRRTESFDSGQSKIPGFGIPDPEFFQNQAKLFEQQNNQQNHHQLQQQQQQQQQQHQQQQHQKINVGSHSPLPLRNTIVIPTLKGFESPSPRQRCRIRTNPWYSTTDTSSSGTTIATTQAFLVAKKMELDASSSSSGIKSSSEAGASDKNEKNEKTSDESTSETSSSSTEVENLQRTYSPNTIRRKKQLGELLLTSSCRSEMHSLHQQGSHHHLDSDEDATLNEMMGKFDESYVYEKETDILSSSDSDPTDCASDLDTGQDAGDECDTDDMLDIEFIDTTLVGPEAALVKTYQLPRRASRQRHMKTYPGEDISKRRKRLMKTRKKSTESKGRGSPMKSSRESRSLGGTPVCLRRNQSADNQRSLKAQTLSTRCSSLTFTEVHAIRSKFIAIGESEKALLRADLEADVKYRQLIHEAETILVSMKTSALSIPRETPVASPRRICNPLANKRVEMLKQCEADIKRELLKQQQKSLDAENNISIDNGALNKRLESLKYETNSAPNSPKSSRFSPRKTHITNFINQNAPPEVPPRRSSIPEPPPRSPQLQVNGRAIKGRSASPLSHRRRFRSQSPKKQQAICSDSDSDDNSNSSMIKQNLSRRSRSLRSTQDETDDRSNRNCLPEIQKITIYNESDYTNRNVKPTLMSFKSFGGTATAISMSSYCPQSEPLKRKVYRGSSSFERIKKSLDLDSEIPKQAILDKINNMRRERQSSTSIKSSNQDMNQCITDEQPPLEDDEPTSVSSNLSTKQQLILNTIEDLKRSLEYQSVELNGLNEDE